MAYFPAPGPRDLLKAPYSGASTHQNQMKKQLKSASFVKDTLQRLNFTCFRFYH